MAKLGIRNVPLSLRLGRAVYFWVLVGIAAGIVIGAVWPATGEAMKPLGDGFIKLVKMVIAPVVFLTITTGIGGMAIKSVGRVAARAILYFTFFSTLALVIGLVVANVVKPGSGMNIDPASLDAHAVKTYLTQAHDNTIVGFLLDIIPDTLVSAMTQGSLLQVLLVAILFGVSLSILGESVAPVRDLLERLSLVVFRIVGLIMWLAPIGSFGAIAFTIGKYGLSPLINLGTLIATFYVTSALFVLVVLGAVARLNGFSIFALLRYLKSELLLILGTSSSEVALPSLMEKMERAGCARPIVGLVVPTGYSFNLDGTNIYMTLAALFISQAMNIDLSIEQQLVILLVAMVSSKGAAGVTGAGFVTLAATLSVLPNVPAAGLVLILGIDRFMSECRSLTNFIGNAVATVVVARWDGALDEDKLRKALSGGTLEVADEEQSAVETKARITPLAEHAPKLAEAAVD